MNSLSKRREEVWVVETALLWEEGVGILPCAQLEAQGSDWCRELAKITHFPPPAPVATSRNDPADFPGWEETIS